MQTESLPRYNRKTTLRVKLTDLLAGVGIRVGGLGVIFAVLGLIVFIGWQVIPLFGSAEAAPAAPAAKVTDSEVLVLRADEYRRVVVCVERSGQVTIFGAGKVINRFKPPELGEATLSAACVTLRPLTKKRIEAVDDVTHYHVLLATTDGRVFVASIGFVTDFMSFELGNEPPELTRLIRPDEDRYKAADYMPEAVIMDGKFIEHVPTFGLYRAIQPRFTIEREMEVDTGGRPVRVINGQIGAGKETEERGATAVIVTDDGRTRIVSETVKYNRIRKKLSAEADTLELTGALSGPPDFVLVNELQDEVILASHDGTVHHFARRGAQPFVLQYPAFNVFQGQADRKDGVVWRTLIDEQRDDYGLPQVAGGLRLTAVNYLLGDGTVVFGDSHGGLQSWFGVIDGGEGLSRLQRIRSLPPGAAAITEIEGSEISKAALVTDASGRIRAIHNTAERVFAELQLESPRRAVFSRKADGILAVDDRGELHHWWLDAPHAEVSLTSLFGKVWYEDYPEPKYEWQSTGGTDDVEPKLSLVPLMIGTLKGAIYALVFAIPLGVLAAIYTSEFMHRNMRAILKPTMEVMASLPSVVLGFLAALYFAPLAAPMMPTLVVAAVIVPGVYMVFGWLWQRCPPSIVGKFGYWRSTILLFLLLALGIWISSFVGPRAEVFLFPAAEGANPAMLDPVTLEPATLESQAALAAGDFRTWTGGGKPLPRDTEYAGKVLPKGWWNPGGHNLLVTLLAIPLALLAGLGLRSISNLLRKRTGKTPVESLRTRLEGPRRASLRAVAVDAGFSLGTAAILLGVGYLLSLAVTPLFEFLFFSYDHPTAGRVADFRRFFTDLLVEKEGQGWAFEQSNSLIVGFAMGFAVIPIIYTIAEDALTSVPNQLRAASLACGASRWQTTTRVVLPAAASGIFSGIVIGLGRALGETMIVLMAAGGTPVLEMQPLVGFRSLSAAIATEMPEAPHGGTLYRTLFLAGLVLFLMTFVINTVAEAVRIRLRRKLSRL